VVTFDRANCPSGWSRFTKATGRVIVGARPGGTVGAVVGTGLGDKEVRMHQHSVNIPGFQAGTAGSHNHLAMVFTEDGTWSAGNGAALVSSTTGMDYSGSGFYYVGISSGPAVVYTANAGTHGHLVDPPRRWSSKAWNQVPYVQLTFCKKD
jgi:hypothetical protein